jgi:mono/diheme cytochrome c family protein
MTLGSVTLRSVTVGAITVGSLALAACSGQMADQPSYKTGRIALLPASGSLPVTPSRPWAMRQPPGTATASNPIVVTQAVLADGKKLYTDNCGFCHGAAGKGDGPVGEVYAPRPADLHLPRLVSATDGRIYEVITNGYSTMPAFYKRLDPESRWRIVAYVRELQRGRD